VREELLGQSPQLPFEAHPELVVPHIETEISRPLVFVEPDRRDLGCQLASEGRLTRRGKPTDEDEPRR
jgi:hypothetical protein